MASATPRHMWQGTPLKTLLRFLVGIAPGIVSFIAAQPADAGSSVGLTASQAAELSKTKIAIVLPARVPDGFQVYGAVANTDFYEVLYSDGLKSFIVKTASAGDVTAESKTFRATGEALHSSLFGAYRVAEGAVKDYNIGCYSHDPVALHAGNVRYQFIACGSLTADQLRDLVASAMRVPSLHRSVPESETAPTSSGLTTEQERRLRNLPMPVALLASLPKEYRVVSFRAENGRGPGGVSYSVDYSDGRGKIHVDGTSSGFGDADVPVRRLNVPVHSKLFGEMTLIVDPRDSDCITERELLTISLQPGYSIVGCHVAPYEMKRIIESARLLRPL